MLLLLFIYLLLIHTVADLSTLVQPPSDNGIQSPTPPLVHSGSNTMGASRSQTVPNFSSVNRSVSQKPAMGRPSLNFTETDSSAAVKRKPSTPLLHVWNRSSKGMGSQEDLSSLSNSTSLTSLTSTLSQVSVMSTL